MASERALKRQKTNPPEDEQSPGSAAAQTNSQSQPNTQTDSSINDAPESQSNRSSWYSRTWPRKAAPVTQVARESISSASTVAAETVKSLKDKAVDKVSTKSKNTRSPSLAMTLGKGKSGRSLPVDATITKVNVMPESSSRSRAQSTANSTREDDTTTPVTNVAGSGQVPQTKSDTNGAEPASEAASQKKDQAETGGVETHDSAAKSEQRSSWMGWWSQASGNEADNQGKGKGPEPVGEKGSEVKNNDKQPDKSNGLPTVVKQGPSKIDPPTSVPDPDAPQMSQTQNSKRGWLQIWSNPATENTSAVTTSIQQLAEYIPTKIIQKTTSENSTAKPNVKQGIAAEASNQTTMIEELAAPSDSLPQPSKDGQRTSGWAFWSRDTGSATSGKSEDLPHVGELAISDTPSQERPRRASINLQVKPQDRSSIPASKPVTEPSVKPTPAVTTPKYASSKSKNEEVSKASHAKPLQPDRAGSKAKFESSNATATARAPVDANTSRPASPAPSNANVENILLPSLRETLKLQENLSLMQHLGRLLYPQQQADLKHLLRVQSPPRIKHALAIGVHGYFPAPLIRTVLGQPTGTSIKFADMAAKSIRKYTKAHGYECEVKSAALEGEGKIADRIELLWKLLLNWIDEIRKSDFVLIACHSQGVPVAVMLVAKLIEFGCVNGARVGICAMAGVNMGPFMEYKTRWISGSAGELFEFSNMSSQVSQDYFHALEVVLQFGVRLSFIGSIDDQLVSLESSVYAPLTHPHIFRAVFIDGRIHAPNFLSHLVGFALKLRNIGVPDHGLIRELSSPLAGSLYSGEGHSRIYEDEAVYDLAVEFALETTSAPNTSLKSSRSANITAGNPYVLPFAMRGILEEDYVKNEYAGEALELLKQFDDWKPTTKVLKDVKFRLEGIRSRL